MSKDLCYVMKNSERASALMGLYHRKNSIMIFLSRNEIKIHQITGIRDFFVDF